MPLISLCFIVSDHKMLVDDGDGQKGVRALYICFSLGCFAN